MADHAPNPDAATSGVPPEWLDDTLPKAFIKWHAYRFGAEADTTLAIIEAAGIQPGSRVVDIGSGSGIPALSIAQLVGNSGHVAATDPSPIFVAALMDNAAELGLTNIDAVQASAAQLPFPSASFDAATCHFGVMFFTDVQAGLRQIHRVLQPGGRAGFICWGPTAQNSFFGAGTRVVASYQPLPSLPDLPLTDYPNSARFSQSGSLSAHLRNAGFGDVREETRMMEVGWNGDVASLAQYWFESRGLARSLPAEKWDAVKNDFRTAFAPFVKEEGLRFPAAIVVASGSA